MSGFSLDLQKQVKTLNFTRITAEYHPSWYSPIRMDLRPPVVILRRPIFGVQRNLKLIVPDGGSPRSLLKCRIKRTKTS